MLCLTPPSFSSQRKSPKPSGNVKLETYFGPTEEPKFQRPWEQLKYDLTCFNL